MIDCIKIEEIIRRLKGDLIYSLISFNYTNVLDKCAEATKKVLGNKLGTYIDINMQKF